MIWYLLKQIFALVIFLQLQKHKQNVSNLPNKISKNFTKVPGSVNIYLKLKILFILVIGVKLFKINDVCAFILQEYMLQLASKKHSKYIQFLIKEFQIHTRETLSMISRIVPFLLLEIILQQLLPIQSSFMIFIVVGDLKVLHFPQVFAYRH